MIKRSALEKYERFLSLGEKEPCRLERSAMAERGAPAMDSFHAFESSGKLLPTSEPDKLNALLTGKELHGVTVKTVAECFVERLAFSDEIKANYPAWVSSEIFRQAAKIAMKRVGFVPTFIRNQKDFSEA